MPTQVHIDAYRQRRDGRLIEVSAHVRGGGGAPSPETAYCSYADATAEAEGSKNKPHGGARERNPKTNALGSYQMLRDAFRAIGWQDEDGRWTSAAREWGIDTDEAFLDAPDAQEYAMRAYTRDNRRQLVANKSLEFVGRKFVSPNGRSFTVSEAGVLAAAHRAGASRTKRVLEKLARKSAGNSPNFDDKERAAISRMRMFEDVPYADPR